NPEPFALRLYPSGHALKKTKKVPLERPLHEDVKELAHARMQTDIRVRRSVTPPRKALVVHLDPHWRSGAHLRLYCVVRRYSVEQHRRFTIRRRAPLRR